MNERFMEDGRIQPEVIVRRGGGYLAVTPRWAAVRLGAAGQTRKEACARFAQVVSTWAIHREEELRGSSDGAADSQEPA